MQRKSTNRPIDYHKLNSTGQIEPKDTIPEHHIPSTVQRNMEDAKIEISVTIDEVHDIIDENPIYGSIQRELDATITRLQTYRNQDYKPIGT